MPYTPDTWANNDPTKPLNATRLTKLAGQYPQVMADLPAKIADSGDPIGAALSSTFVALDEPGFDIVVLLGQSNMDGRGTTYNGTTDPADSRVYVLAQSGTYAGQIIQATEPLPGYMTPSGMGPGLNFARWYATAIAPARRVLLLPLAKGGVPFEGASSPAGFTWKVGRNDVTNLWSNAATKITEALALAGDGSRVAVALMVHGESDGDNGTTGATYQADLDALIGALRTHVGTTVPVILGQMVPEYLGTGTRAAINAVIAATPSRLPSVRFAAGPFGETKNDGNHYESGGARKLGRNLFAAYLRLVEGTNDPALPAVPAQVTGLAAGTVTPASVPLSWSSAARASAYLVERKLTSGGSWTTVGTTTATSIAATGLAVLTSYDFRVTALNGSGPGTVSATLTASTAAPTDITDSFNRANSSSGLGAADTGETWTALDGVMGITSNAAAPVTMGTAQIASVIDMGVADVTLQATISAISSASVHNRIILRAANSGSLLALQARVTSGVLGKIQLYSLAGVTFTLVAESSGNAALNDVITVTAIGSAITVKQNGSTVISTTSTLNQTATKHGIAFSGADANARLDAFSADLTP